MTQLVAFVAVLMALLVKLGLLEVVGKKLEKELDDLGKEDKHSREADDNNRQTYNNLRNSKEVISLVAVTNDNAGSARVLSKNFSAKPELLIQQELKLKLSNKFKSYGANPDKYSTIIEDSSKGLAFMIRSGKAPYGTEKLLKELGYEIS